MSSIALFDIDGTLVDIFKHHSQVYEKVALEVYDAKVSFDLVKCSGNSIICNMVQVLAAAGISKEQVFEKMPQALESITMHLKHRFSSGIEDCVLPGVKQMLSDLKIKQIPIGITTGNSRDVGELILEKAGLIDYFKFGAFADEVANSEDRKYIVNLAIKRAKEVVNSSVRNVFVIGDTPQDILSAKSVNASSIAVATGLHNISELRTYNPTYLFDNFKNYSSVVDIISDNN